ncbi:hypothetical protein PISL3812_08818 [Talaromyces islandicus]|uniref:Mis18 domain-containing protein n=1 Tax=Talaromyces islandicus TaxID=28573 RepID=A0A0U1MA31_TALIS|nr:hypothetical protein PISL3812_08818 [Talaromyces islandicus]
MDLSHLGRPSILCQCACCSSSLAACENEWAKLSDTYSTLTGWVSIDIDRIKVSSEKKQIPQSSNLDFVRGRLIQEIVCRLCHQKLGALVHLEPDAKVFWKLSNVSFREIISMKESQPIFREGSLSWLLFPDQQVVSQVGSAESASGSHVPEAALSKAIQNQGLSLHRISSSVDELHDTMADLKESFRALRLELNTTSSYRGQVGQCDEAMDMLKIVLRELQCKADEIEKLKLENDSLKLKTRYLEERQQSGLALTPHLPDSRCIPTVQSPGFLNETEGRRSPKFITTGQVADSFEGDNESIDHGAVFEPSQPVRVPLKPAAETLPMHIRQSQDDRNSQGTTRPRRDSGEPATKRQRLNESEDSGGPPTGEPTRERPRGRPRKSQPSISQAQQNSNLPTTTTIENSQEALQNSSVEDSSVHPVDEATGSEGPKPRGRRRTASKASSTSQAKSRVTRQSKTLERDLRQPPESQDETIETMESLKNPAEVAVSVAELTPESEIESHLFPTKGKEGNQVDEGRRENSKERRNRVSNRHTLAKAAMEREEAMADG